MKLQLCSLLLSASAILALSSCEAPRMTTTQGGPHTGVHSYTKLPPTHKGYAYYHQGRYYTGGQYQSGSYTHQGKRYTSRYYHNGQYYYGGQHQSYPRPDDHSFQHGDFPAGNYPDGNYQGTSWMERQPF